MRTYRIKYEKKKTRNDSGRICRLTLGNLRSNVPTTLHVHHTFLYIFFTVLARLRREDAQFRVLIGERKQATAKFYFSF